VLLGHIAIRSRHDAPVNPNKALWEKGDFTRIAATMRESGETLVEKLGITKGMQVLDLGCGDGTTRHVARRAKSRRSMLGSLASRPKGRGAIAQPRSSTCIPFVIPSFSTSVSPLSRMVAAIRVKSPFSRVLCSD